MAQQSQRPSPVERNAYLPWLARQLWCAASDQARAVNATVWRRWALCLLVGYLVSASIAGGAVLFARAWADRGLSTWDQHWLDAIAGSWFTFPAGLWFEAWGSSAFLIPMLVVCMVLLVRAGYLFRAVTLVVGYLSTKGLVLGAWQLWDRVRPDSVAGGVAAPGLHSFPSGHAVNAVVMFGLIGVFWWRASRSVVERAAIVAGVGLVVLLTCLGRVRLGTHWPSDVIGGLVIGVSWLLALGVAVALAEGTASRAAVNRPPVNGMAPGPGEGIGDGNQGAIE